MNRATTFAQELVLEPPLEVLARATELRRAGDLVVGCFVLDATTVATLVGRGTWSSDGRPTSLVDPRYFAFELGRAAVEIDSEGPTPIDPAADAAAGVAATVSLLVLAYLLVRYDSVVAAEGALACVFEARRHLASDSADFPKTLAAEAMVRRRLAQLGVATEANLAQAAALESPTATVRIHAAPAPRGAYLLVREYIKEHIFAAPSLARELEVTLLDETTLGADPSCTIALRGEYISPLHCRVLRDAGRFTLVDQSSDGTFVDGVGRIAQRVLEPGDWFALGLARVQFQQATPARVEVRYRDEPVVVLDLAEEVTLGRHPENAVQILDPTVAKFHGRITREGDRHVFRDLATLNGSAVRGARVAEHLLEHGDEVVVGAAHITYVRGPFPTS